MSGRRRARDEQDERLQRQIGLYALGFAAAAVAIALAGSALIAWLALPELPFLAAWSLVLAGTVLGVALAFAVRWVGRRIGTSNERVS